MYLIFKNDSKARYNLSKCCKSIIDFVHLTDDSTLSLIRIILYYLMSSMRCFLHSDICVHILVSFFILYISVFGCFFYTL